jgi:multidrug resistance efflux pump
VRARLACELAEARVTSAVGDALAQPAPDDGDPLAAHLLTLHEATLDLFASDDPGAIAGKLLRWAPELLPMQTVSLWVPDGDNLECRGALGARREQLTGASIHRSSAAEPTANEEGLAVIVAEVAAGGDLIAVLRGTRSLADANGFAEADQELLNRLASAAGTAIEHASQLATSRRAADDSARDLAVITEMSREITSTLDLDHVLRMVVNLATRMLEFDCGAVALYEHGTCDIRAVAGADGVDAKSDALQDLAVRAAWAAGTGEPFYLSDREDPASDAERTFVQVFGEDLERDRAESGLYLPLRDEGGIVGILLFEARNTGFASPRQRGMAAILAAQATVAVRNAQLYRQVPLADALTAISAKRQALLALPRRRRMVYALAAVATIAALTLIRWPLRVPGNDPVFRPLLRAEARPTLSGVVDRVFVREGDSVALGAPLFHLRDDELRARWDAAIASRSAAERAAAIAATSGDAAGEQLQRIRAAAAHREAELLNEQLLSTVVRSPATGVVLTARPEERIGTYADAGELLAIIGRTDSLEVDLGVEQHDVARVRVGNEVRLRVSALPQRTFSGRLVSVGSLPEGDESGVWYPARAVFANDEALLRPGMAAYARVLTDRASVLGRITRDPMRALRLFWWRIWS